LLPEVLEQFNLITRSLRTIQFNYQKLENIIFDVSGAVADSVSRRVGEYHRRFARLTKSYKVTKWKLQVKSYKSQVLQATSYLSFVSSTIIPSLL
jgi:hypothetical protein